MKTSSTIAVLHLTTCACFFNAAAKRGVTIINPNLIPRVCMRTHECCKLLLMALWIIFTYFFFWQHGREVTLLLIIACLNCQVIRFVSIALSQAIGSASHHVLFILCYIFCHSSELTRCISVFGSRRNRKRVRLPPCMLGIATWMSHSLQITMCVSALVSAEFYWISHEIG